MPTEKLYWSDPWATTFDAKPQAGELGGRRSLVLDRTLFYPEAGGQLADTGTLRLAGKTLDVVDVQIDDGGVIHHLLAEADATDLPRVLDSLNETSADARVAYGAIDSARRREHMAAHTAQHALSRALVEVARADTISSRLGATACTIDVDGAVTERDLARAEDLVAAVVMDDVPVRALFPTREELARMPLRRAPKVDRDVRVIEIEGFDLSPCGGTHCTRTGQIGVVRVVGLERYKGGWRITFHAGKRALEDARRKEAVLAELAREFTCGLLDVGSAVGKLRADLKARSDALSAARGELVDLLARRTLEEHPPHPRGTTPIVIERPHGDLGMLRALAGRLAARGDVVAVCAAPDERNGDERLIVIQRGSSATFDCGNWLKSVAAAHGGRGGGRPDRAEGRLPARLSLEELVQSASQSS
jgi:alanyl-tRNA synthetase